VDPESNMREQLELAEAILAGTCEADELVSSAERLAELVVALAEWRKRGGFAG